MPSGHGELLPLAASASIKELIDACAEARQPPGAVAAAAVVAAVAAAVGQAGDVAGESHAAWRRLVADALRDADSDIEAYWGASVAASVDTPQAVSKTASRIAAMTAGIDEGNRADLGVAYLLSVAAAAAASLVARYNKPEPNLMGEAALLRPAAKMRSAPLVTIARAQGCYVYDEAHDKWFDASSGMWNVPLGHGHPAPLAAMLDQAARLSATDPFQTDSAVVEAAARRIRDYCEYPRAKVIFGSSGSEVIEIAMRLGLAALPADAPVWAMPSAFHGSTAGAAALSAFDAVWGPLPHSAKWPRTATPAHWTAPGLAFAEPLSPSSGYEPLAREDVEQIRRFQRDGGILVMDEITTGLGRAGNPLAAPSAGIQPDMTAVGKGLGNGLIPVSALLVDADVAHRAIGDRAIDYGHTHTNHVLAAASAVIDTLSSLRYPQRSGALRAACGRAGLAVRGSGFLAVISGRPVDRQTVLNALTSARLLCHLPTMSELISQLVLAPPLTATDGELDDLIERAGMVASHLGWRRDDHAEP